MPLTWLRRGLKITNSPLSHPFSTLAVVNHPINQEPWLPARVTEGLWGPIVPPYPPRCLKQRIETLSMMRIRDTYDQVVVLGPRGLTTAFRWKRYESLHTRKDNWLAAVASRGCGWPTGVGWSFNDNSEETRVYWSSWKNRIILVFAEITILRSKFISHELLCQFSAIKLNLKTFSKFRFWPNPSSPSSKTTFTITANCLIFSVFDFWTKI